MNFKSKLIIIILVVVVVIIAAAGFWYWSKNKQVPLEKQEAPTLGGQIFEKTQNPTYGKLPDTNPFKDQKNPFDVIYDNPFK
ncbi:MAG: hypothetical protein AAB884_00515 [Patescibacteria group bacterium]